MPTIEQLQTLLESEPADPFLNFGLAMALAKVGRNEEALARFDRAIASDGSYVAAYFHKGRLLAGLGKLEEAKAVLGAGIERARACGDLHATGEMRDYLASLG